MIRVQTFSKGKTAERNEDYFDYNKTSFVIADGATDKSGRSYSEKTGGQIVSKLVVQEALSSALNGAELVDFLNKKVYQQYESLNITNDIARPQYRFTSGCIVVRIIAEQVFITYIGDLGFRINGNTVYQEVKQIDIDNAEERANYIKQTGDIHGSREHIKPLLLKQLEYQNNPQHPLGYGAIDGTTTPEKFIKTFQYPKKEIHLLELFTDGYFSIPSGTTISDWEKAFEKVEQEDPDKCKTHKSTKSNDDRTIAIIQL